MFGNLQCTLRLEGLAPFDTYTVHRLGIFLLTAMGTLSWAISAWQQA